MAVVSTLNGLMRATERKQVGIDGSRSRYPAERMIVRIEWMQFASKWVAPQEYRLVPWKKFREIRRFFIGLNKEGRSMLEFRWCGVSMKSQDNKLLNLMIE